MKDRAKDYSYTGYFTAGPVMCEGCIVPLVKPRRFIVATLVITLLALAPLLTHHQGVTLLQQYEFRDFPLSHQKGTLVVCVLSLHN